MIDSLRGFLESHGSMSHYEFVPNLALVLSRRIGTPFNQDLMVLKCHLNLEHARL